MTKFKVYYTTTVEQSVDVDIELEEGDDGFGSALEAGWEYLRPVPFIGWEFDASGDWEPSGAVNQEPQEDYYL